MSGPSGVDVFQRLGVGEGQFIGSNSHNAAISVMEFFEPVVEIASLEGDGIGQSICSPYFGAWKARKRVEKDVVDSEDDDILDFSL